MRILIVGAGSAGLTTAFWLSRDGHNLTIVEKSPALRDDGHEHAAGTGARCDDRLQSRLG